jgi:phosphopantetheine--protein transferase-like protein
MILGVGIDIENHSRFLKYISPNFKPEYLLSVFTQDELDNYSKFNNHLCYAVSFSCKESFLKAFGVGWNNSKIQWGNIELLFNEPPENKNTNIRISGHARKLLDEFSINSFYVYNYSIDNSVVVFESILTCKTK